jgi:hypothetical protein
MYAPSRLPRIYSLAEREDGKGKNQSSLMNTSSNPCCPIKQMDINL